MPVAELVERVDMHELMGWLEYFRRIDNIAKKEQEPPSLAEIDPDQVAAMFGAPPAAPTKNG